ncbi:hypothetical protein Aph02nite_53110 [Actinoplanes philippinensis]|uniref:UPF0434 protein SAMN05421541_11050 n=1 Tax=Actinoplanes philippinensis TaxID=35752 RepID=A0A1I2IJ94_9ACTN|nr:Trm112 family protein [Actinoplanes philippinensis]GIE79361.1 hypothetical protein Aph02nite_53110 [Actinoplanes philippinensis]SFF41723.1 hypothetical protein SAMN05421541_11050 [Actinoplanes philippinensis]
MALDQQLLEILACPDTHHAPLEHDAGAQTLTCTECGRIFEIRDDIPILLLDEAREPGSPAASGPAGPAGSPDAAGSSDDSVEGSN